MNGTAMWAIEEELPFTSITEPVQGGLVQQMTKRIIVVLTTCIYPMHHQHHTCTCTCQMGNDDTKGINGLIAL